MSSHLDGLQQTEALVPGVVESDLVRTRRDEQVTVPGVCAAKHLLVVVGNLDNEAEIILIISFLFQILKIPFCSYEATVLSWTKYSFVPELKPQLFKDKMKELSTNLDAESPMNRSSEDVVEYCPPVLSPPI